MKTLQEIIEELNNYVALMQRPTLRRFENIRSKVLRGRIPQKEEQFFLGGLLRIMRSPNRERIMRGDLKKQQIKIAGIRGWR